ncbi:MAG: hypothetical protein GX595_13535, partial [Lentisphaerae bacterium]|nr:hypothetical protein [Lentisphaerota bacterium]
AGNPGSALAEVTWIEPDTAVTDAVIIATGTAQVLTIAGGRNRIDGGIHSNDEVHIAAGQTRVNGRVSAHGNVRFTGPKVWAGAVAPKAGIVTLPTFALEEFRRRADVTYPDSQRFDGDLPDGLHVVDGDVTLTGNLSARVTIVASGDILLAAGQRRLQAWDRTGILFLAGGDIRVSGSTNHFTGTLHAPDGCFSTAGCRNAFLDSRIWAREVAIIGGWNDFGQARQEDPATTRPRPVTASRQRPRQASHREDSAP